MKIRLQVLDCNGFPIPANQLDGEATVGSSWWIVVNPGEPWSRQVRVDLFDDEPDLTGTGEGTGEDP